MGKAMLSAAENPASGGAAEGMGLGMGFAMANRMINNPALAGAGGAVVPPPLPSAWHLAINGQTQGPFSLGQIQQGIASGQIAPGTPVWTQGMAAWLPYEQIPALNVATAAPPPPPPTGN